MMPATLRARFWGQYSRLGLSVAAGVFVVDQAHKWWMLLGYDIRTKGRVEVAPFLDLVFALNKGVSYSFFTSADPRTQYALFAFSAVASFALAVWLARHITSPLAAVSVGLILGGALGNGLDRLTLGGVADFFSLHAFGYYWYVFNIADVAIVAGVVGLLYDSLSPGPVRPPADDATKST